MPCDRSRALSVSSHAIARIFRSVMSETAAMTPLGLPARFAIGL